MQNSNHTVFHNITTHSKRQLVLPFNFEEQLPEHDIVFLLNAILGELDYTRLLRLYSPLGRKSSVEPDVMFKIIVLAMSEGVYSLREIQERCVLNLRYRWLLQMRKAPSHMAIGRFILRITAEVLEDLFRQFIKILFTIDPVTLTEIYIDGTKLEANANRYSFKWKKKILKNLEKLREKFQGLKILAENTVGTDVQDMDDGMLTSFLYKLCEQQEIEFTHGKGHKKHELQKLLEESLSIRNKRMEYEKDLLIMGERNSYSTTDHDATFMRMKEDHMKNGQLKPAYNVQLGIGAEYIVGLGVYPNPTDTRTLKPFVGHLEKNMGIKPEYIVADAGYYSEENLQWLKDNNIKSVIKPSTYETDKTKKHRKDIGSVRNMQYNAEKDCYICSKGRELTFEGEWQKKNNSGYTSTVKTYSCSNCNYCGYRKECQKHGNGISNKAIQINENYNMLQKENLERFTSEIGIRMRINRSIQVEGAFGVIKGDYNYRRVLRKGKEAVYKELMLLAFGFNIRKLHNRISANRIGKRFLDKAAA